MNTPARSLPGILILTLCLAGMLVFTLFPVAGAPLIETDFETDLDEDTLLYGSGASLLSYRFSIKPDRTNLKFSSLRALPVAPPPKQA